MGVVQNVTAAATLFHCTWAGDDRLKKNFGSKGKERESGFATHLPSYPLSRLMGLAESHIWHHLVIVALRTGPAKNGKLTT
jgi:hypothetical protein